jgi:hypothetical protein
MPYVHLALTRLKHTAPHMFACECRAPWREQLITSLRKLLDKIHIQPDLNKTLLLLLGIKDALPPRLELHMMTTHCEASFAMLVIISQNDIGWSHLLRGRFSHHWVQVQQAHINRDDHISSKTFTPAGQE